MQCNCLSNQLLEIDECVENYFYERTDPLLFRGSLKAEGIDLSYFKCI